METSGTSYKWKALATVALSTMMGAMDFTFVNLSLPMLTKIFKTDLATVVWLNLTFSVVLVCLGPFLGKINDVVGRKKVFVTGSVFIAFGLVACSLSQTIGQLILFRVVYAIGNAMTSTCHAAIITDAFPQNERGKGLGLQNSSLSLGFIIGFVAGGILLNWLGWRSIFYVRVPVGLILFLMALTLLRKDKPKATNIRFDIAGTLTSTVGLLSLILGLSLIAKLGLQSPIVYTLITAGLLFLALFIYVERKAEDAMVDLSLFKNRTFSGAMVSLLFYWMAVQGLALTSPFYLMEGRSMAASYVGILFTVGTITSLLISPLSGSLSDRFGALSLSAIGAVIGLVAYSFWLSFSQQTPIFLVVSALIIGGVAGGTYLTTNGSAIMGSVRPEQRGSASALMMSMTGLSLSLGMTWAGTVYSMRRVFHQAELTRQGLGADLAANQSIHLSFHDNILISICLQVLVLLFSLLPRVMAWRTERRNQLGARIGENTL